MVQSPSICMGDVIASLKNDDLPSTTLILLLGLGEASCRQRSKLCQSFHPPFIVTGNDARSMVLTDRLNVLHSQGASLQPFIYSVS